MATKLTGAKHQSYTVSDNLRIVNFAEQHRNRAAEREFGVSESNVRLWRKSKENLEKMPRLKRANRGKKAAWPELEIDLLEWITEKWNNGLAILPSLVRLKTLDMAKLEKYGIPAGQFKVKLVPAFHEAEWLVSSTENNSRSAASR
jgi:transposase